MHKTGSSTIQTNLNAVRHHEGWRYIKVEKDKANTNGAVHAMFSSHPAKYHTFRNHGANDEELRKLGARLRRKLEARIRRATEETLILSAESLSIMDRQGIASLAEFLRPLVDEIRVIGYVRNPAEFISSNFQERVKHGKKTFRLSECAPKYRTRFRKFDAVFGKKQVDVVKFDPRAFTNHCVVRDFCERTGISLPPGTVVKTVNEGLCARACALLFTYYRFGPGYGVGKYVVRENRYIVRTLLAMKGAKFRLSGEIIAPELADQAEDLAWMENRLGSALSREAKPSADDVSREEDLLVVGLDTLREFGKRFGKITGTRPPRLPAATGGIVDPQAAATYVQTCRELAGEKLRKSGGRSIRKRKGPFARLLRRLKKSLGRADR